MRVFSVFPVTTVIFWFKALASKLGITMAFITVFKFLTKRNGILKVSILDVNTPIFIRPRTSDISAFFQIFIENDNDLSIDIKVFCPFSASTTRPNFN